MRRSKRVPIFWYPSTIGVQAAEIEVREEHSGNEGTIGNDEQTNTETFTTTGAKDSITPIDLYP